MGIVQPGQVDRFMRAIAARLALQFEPRRADDLARTLGRRAHAKGLGIDAYLAWLESGSPDADVDALAPALTVGETSFFRNIEQFQALRECVVPELLRVRGGLAPLRVLSAGCASGEEAYSLAMCLRDMGADIPVSWPIRAVDLNPAMIQKARQGVYTAWALRDTPSPLQDRWFRVDAGRVTVDAGIRRAVEFEQANLAADDARLWQPGAYDIVFCRNVLMYFTQPAAQAVVARIERSLAPDGYLFLGYAETLRGWSDAFELCQANGTFFYRRAQRSREAGRAAAAVEAARSPARRPAAPSGPARLQAASSPVRAGTPRPLDRALELFRQERFGEALDVLRALDDEAATGPDAMLLHAVLLAHRGHFAQAEQACRRLLALDETHAGAYYLLALCREGLGDAAGAARDHRCAIELDPAFSMPRLHLGVLARRAGDREGSRRHLHRAVALLEREDTSRLLLFGGGFGREALLAICHAELRQCEEPA